MKPLYNRLFSIYQQIQGAPDAFELFVGVGLFHSRIDPEHLFRRHVLAFPAELSLDERTAALSVGPAIDFTNARFETDFIPTTERTATPRNSSSMEHPWEAVAGWAGLSPTRDHRRMADCRQAPSVASLSGDFRVVIFVTTAGPKQIR